MNRILCFSYENSGNLSILYILNKIESWRRERTSINPSTAKIAQCNIVIHSINNV